MFTRKRSRSAECSECSRRQAEGRKQKAGSSGRVLGLRSAFCPLLSAFCFLPSAFCLLLSAFCFLPSAFCLLLSALCFLPSAFCPLRPVCYCHAPSLTSTLPRFRANGLRSVSDQKEKSPRYRRSQRLPARLRFARPGHH